MQPQELDTLLLHLGLIRRLSGTCIEFGSQSTMTGTVEYSTGNHVILNVMGRPMTSLLDVSCLSRAYLFQPDLLRFDIPF